jgi:LysM repeat protein
MKILKIFGIVVAVHAVAFMFVFAIPGCRSTSRQVSPSLATETTSKPSSESTAPDRSAAPVAPTQTGVSPSVSNADLNPGISSAGSAPAGSGDTGIHFNRSSPTRPGTPVAGALETPPVADVTSVKTYVVAKGDSVSLIAKKNGISAKELVEANNLKKDAILVAGKKLIIPAKAAASAPAPTPASGTSPASPAAPGSSAETLTYEVKSGDTLDRIAKHSGTTVAAIKNLNKLKSDVVHVGQKLTIPVGANSAATLATAHEPDATVNSAPAAQAAAAVPTPAGGTTYVVKPNEGLSVIAKKFGVRLSDIAALNNISDPKKVRAGQTLVIPAPTKGKATPPANTPAPSTTPASTPAPTTSPVSPATPPSDSTPSSPLSAPSTDTVPPINKVEEPNPAAPAKN